MAVTCWKLVAAIIWNQILYPIRHYFPDIRANHRPGCWKQLPLPVPHCWQYRRRLESIATVRIMIADPSLEVCVPRHLSRLWRPAETLLGLRQGQLYVAGDSDIRLSRCRKGGMRDFLSLYIRTTRKMEKVREKFLILAKYFFGLHEWWFFSIWCSGKTPWI